MWHGHESSTTGHVGYRADMWTVLRSYDEEGIMGSGSQVIGMANRRKVFVGNQIFAIYPRGSMDDSHKVVGHPLPNDTNNARADRSTANTCQCYSPMGLTWRAHERTKLVSQEIHYLIVASSFATNRHNSPDGPTSSLWLKGCPGRGGRAPGLGGGG